MKKQAEAMKTTRAEQKYENMANCELPEYIRAKNINVLVIETGNEWQGKKKHNVSIEDVIHYYFKDARNITSGVRSLGTIVGDWRPVDRLAKECLEIFKIINKTALKRAGRKCGMELKN